MKTESRAKKYKMKIRFRMPEKPPMVMRTKAHDVAKGRDRKPKYIKELE